MTGGRRFVEQGVGFATVLSDDTNNSVARTIDVAGLGPLLSATTISARPSPRLAAERPAGRLRGPEAAQTRRGSRVRERVSPVPHGGRSAAGDGIVTRGDRIFEVVAEADPPLAENDDVFVGNCLHRATLTESKPIVWRVGGRATGPCKGLTTTRHWRQCRVVAQRRSSPRGGVLGVASWDGRSLGEGGYRPSEPSLVARRSGRQDAAVPMW